MKRATSLFAKAAIMTAAMIGIVGIFGCNDDGRFEAVAGNANAGRRGISDIHKPLFEKNNGFRA